ncbi:MAG: amidophosphoribosyltransferase [Planctomycetota bacterium]
MSDPIGHECGLAMVRLRKPITYYRDQYGDAAWGLRRLYLLMEKQHNRGQDGAGVAVVKTDMPPGEQFLVRSRSAKRNALERIFDTVTRDLNTLTKSRYKKADDLKLKRAASYLGEVALGHLRYGTYAGNIQSNCHPYTRKNNTASRTLAIAGNFNLTNSDAVFAQLVEYGLNLVGDSDTQVVLERIGYELDCEHERLRAALQADGVEGRTLADKVSRTLDYQRILQRASDGWDGGYVFAALVGNGDAFVCRDPAGIRPGYIHVTDDIVAVASERVALSSVFNVEPETVREIPPGGLIVIRQDGSVEDSSFAQTLEIRQCTFERIYFSRGNDPDIYRERKALGKQLAPRILDLVDNDIENTVFSFIPNTAEIAYIGLGEELQRITTERAFEDVWARIEAGTVKRDDLERLMRQRVRAEKVAHKDQRLRTFITHDAARASLVAHVYDITRDVVRNTDTLVVVDDSIVRGTTLRESIITMLSRVKPKRIIVASSAPPIMYPDCYGIDMSQLGRFIAFEAAVSLLRESGNGDLLDEIERRCLAQVDRPDAEQENHVGAIYERFTLEELSDRIAKLIRPERIPWHGPIDVVYQSVDGLRSAMPEHTGDWFFTGRYPTPGGYRVLNRSYLKWRQSDDARAY